MRPIARLAATAAASTLVLTGCGSASEPSPPTGIDELVVPSPSLDPSDFVEQIDNPWLPLVSGTTWRYRTIADGKVGVATLTVLDETREVAGVTATIVRTEVVDDGRAATSEAWFAQDVDGNVWSLGEEGVWEAGVGGGEAGLAMPAEPRVGDGYRTEYLPGVAEGRALVTGLDGSASVPYGDLTDLLDTEHSSPLEPGEVELHQYAQGIGLVREVTVPDGDEQVDLVAFEEP